MSLTQLPRRALSKLKRTAITAAEDARIVIENRETKKPAAKRLIILDDFFPGLLSPFRIAEFNALLEHYPDTLVFSTCEWTRSTFEKMWAEYAREYPQYKDRIRKYHPRREFSGSLIYTIFINNAFNFIDTIEKNNIPFIMELYPGGGFFLEDAESDAKMRRVCSSPCFHKVIVTSKVAYDYLLAKQFCRPEQIVFSFGGTVILEKDADKVPPKRRYPSDKPTFDICFVANKYIAQGIDKGYDVFAGVANALGAHREDITFHVVGPFDHSDIDVSCLGNRIKFYGSQKTAFFPDFYAGMDIILSPNRPFILHPGAFDGFPTGCCVEAGLCGTSIFASDVLGMNTLGPDKGFAVAMRPDAQIVIINHDVREICAKIDYYFNHADELYAIGQAGKKRLSEIFNTDEQLATRFREFDIYLK